MESIYPKVTGPGKLGRRRTELDPSKLRVSLVLRIKSIFAGMALILINRFA
jgi:hypothetical protein